MYGVPSISLLCLREEEDEEEEANAFHLTYLLTSLHSEQF